MWVGNTVGELGPNKEPPNSLSHSPTVCVCVSVCAHRSKQSNQQSAGSESGELLSWVWLCMYVWAEVGERKSRAEERERGGCLEPTPRHPNHPLLSVSKRSFGTVVAPLRKAPDSPAADKKSARSGATLRRYASIRNQRKWYEHLRSSLSWLHSNLFYYHRNLYSEMVFRSMIIIKLFLYNMYLTLWWSLSFIYNTCLNLII